MCFLNHTDGLLFPPSSPLTTPPHHSPSPLRSYSPLLTPFPIITSLHSPHPYSHQCTPPFTPLLLTKVSPDWICAVTSRFTKLFYCESANTAHIQSGDTLLPLTTSSHHSPYYSLSLPLTTPHHPSPPLTTPHHPSPPLTTPHHPSPPLTTPHHPSPPLTTPHHPSPPLTTPHHPSPLLTYPPYHTSSPYHPLHHSLPHLPS